MKLIKTIALFFILATAVACQAQTEPAPTNTAVPTTEKANPAATATPQPSPERSETTNSPELEVELETDKSLEADTESEMETDVTEVVFNKPFTLKVGETAVFEDTFLTFTAVSEDSRCPKDVTCVWEGQAIVELDVVGSDGRTSQLQLNTNPPENNLTNDQYSIQLQDLAPYPQTSNQIPQELYEATFIIEQAQE